MKKTITIVLTALSLAACGMVQADPLPGYAVTAIQAVHATIWQANGSYYMTVQDPAGGVYCGVSAQADLAKIPFTRTPLEIVLASIPPLTAEQQAQCNGTVVSAWKVAPNPTATDNPPTRPMKNDQLQPIISRVLVGTPCENTASEPVAIVNLTQQYRHTTNAAGVRGVAVCQQ